MNERCGILFDLDGLLIDSLPIWRAAETRMFEAMGHRYDPEIVRQYLGMNAFDVAATAYRILAPPGPVEKYQAIMREALVAAYATGDIVEMPGAAQCVRRLHGVCAMAVASGSPEEGIAKAVDRLGVAECFDRIVSSETVARG